MNLCRLILDEFSLVTPYLQNFWNKHSVKKSIHENTGFEIITPFQGKFDSKELSLLISDIFRFSIILWLLSFQLKCSF